MRRLSQDRPGFATSPTASHFRLAVLEAKEKAGCPMHTHRKRPYLLNKTLSGAKAKRPEYPLIAAASVSREHSVL